MNGRRRWTAMAVWLLAVLSAAALPAAAQDHGTDDTHGRTGALAAQDVEAAAGEIAHPDGEAAHAGESHGEPALINEPPAGLVPALTTLIIFLLLLVVLGKYAWGPIASGLKAREDKIRQDIADAEAARAKAEATLAEYNARLAAAESSVREMLAKATADGERVATTIRMRAQEEAEEAMQRARRDIDAASKQAVTDIYAQAADLSTTIASKILRRNLNPDDQRDLVNSSLEQLQTSVAKA